MIEDRVGLKIGGRDRDRTCDLIHAMDALSQLSYTPVTEQNNLRMVWRTANILTNIRMKFHRDEHLIDEAAGIVVGFLYARQKNLSQCGNDKPGGQARMDR
jgi:hypothetical protein